jgi:hypothetical protein
MTGCVCQTSGYCERHGIFKPKHWHELCRSRDDYFAAWEAGQGPGQLTTAASIANEKRACRTVQMPPFRTQAWNLVTALAAFVADGLRCVTEKQYIERLRICDACRYRKDNRCLRCGCVLVVKAKGRTFTCPEKQWPILSDTPTKVSENGNEQSTSSAARTATRQSTPCRGNCPNSRSEAADCRGAHSSCCVS